MDGLKEYDGENEIELEKRVKDLVKKKLHIDDDIEMDRIHRTGAKRENHPRTVIFRVLRYKDKMKILKEGRKLKGTNIWINEDYSRKTVEMRKVLLQQIKTRAANGEQGLYLKYLTIKKYKKITRPEDESIDTDHKNGSK